MSTEKGPYYLMKHCDYRKEAAFFGVLVMVGDSPAIDRPMNQFDAQASVDALNAAYVKGYAAGQEAAPPPSGAVVDIEMFNGKHHAQFTIGNQTFKLRPLHMGPLSGPCLKDAKWQVDMLKKAFASSPSVERVASPGVIEDARAVINRWDSPLWEWDKHGHTAGLMANLRKAVESAPSVDEQTERIVELVKEHKKWVRESPLNPTFQRDIDADLRKRIKALLSR